MKILLADDDSITLRMLETTLRRLNAEVICAQDGNRAWELIRSEKPDIALLDWMMPGLEGLDIVKRLKNEPLQKFIYLILLTSNDRTEDITLGLDSGANDYITKPFDKDELKSRIAVGARVVEYENRLERMNAELRKYSSEMEALALERAQQLVQADRMVTLGTMAAGIAHEINNPLTVIQGNIKLIKRVWTQDVNPIFQAAEQERKFGIGSKSIMELLASLEKSSIRMRNIIDGMRNFAHGKGGEIDVIAPRSCVEDAMEICLPKTKTKVEVVTEIAEIPFQTRANAVQITQVLVNLIGNAVDALAGTPEAKIIIRVAANEKSHVVFSVVDNGPGIPKENLEKLWNPFFTTKPMGEGTGLGLFICKSIMEQHGGRLWVESEPGKGATFLAELLNESEFGNFLVEKAKKKSENGEENNEG
jgi:signal transduction histidine kinase